MTQDPQPRASGEPSPWSAAGAADAPPVSFGSPVPQAPYPPVPQAPYPPVAGPPREAQWRPERIETVPGTPYGVVHLAVAPVTSGLAIGGLIAGIASIVVAALVFCLGLSGARDGWGGWVAGAFTVLAGLAGAAGVGLGLAGLRQIRRSGRQSAIRFTGRPLAIAAVSCGGAGAAIAVLGLALSLLVQLR